VHDGHAHAADFRDEARGQRAEARARGGKRARRLAQPLEDAIGALDFRVADEIRVAATAAGAGILTRETSPRSRAARSRIQSSAWRLP
jgi:hypothetical protein